MENKKTVFNDETIKVMRDNAYNLISTFIKNKVPFRLVIWNKDDWDYELPIEVLLTYPLQLVLDIAGDTLNMCKVNDDGITIVTYFENIKYTKFLSYDDTVAVLDAEGQPFLVNDFLPDEEPDDLETAIQRKIPDLTTISKEELLQSMIFDGIPESAAKKSIKVFQKANPDKFTKNSKFFEEA
jgi:transcriptional antiterminator